MTVTAFEPPESVACLVSHPGRTLEPRSPWIRRLCQEVQRTVREGFTLEGSLGTPGYDLTTFSALHAGGRVHLHILPEHRPLLHALESTLGPKDSRCRVLPVRSPGANAGPAARDRQVLDRAALVVGVAIRRGGRLEQLLLERHRWGLRVEVCVPEEAPEHIDHPRLASKKARHSAGTWDPLQSAHPRLLDAGIPPRLPQRQDEIPGIFGVPEGTASAGNVWNDGLEGFSLPPDCPYRLFQSDPLIGRTLVHTTRATTGPWPDQAHWGFVRTLAAGSPEADRRIGAVLKHILLERRLRGSAKLLPGGSPMVCLSAAPVQELETRQAFRAHLARWDARPFGLVFRLEALQAMGAKPVEYLSPAALEERTGEARLFVQRHLPPACDWSHEQEWRLPGDLQLDQLDPSDVRIVLPSHAGALLEPAAQGMFISVP